MELLNRWESFWAGVPRAVLLRSHLLWLERYTESHRSYHSVQHIDDCLRLFDEVRGSAREPRRVEAALWWHDVVYDTTGAVDNEQASADFARRELEHLGCDRAFQDWVAEAIIATKHDRPVADPDMQLVLDIDLHPLGAQAWEFSQHGIAIRREYGAIPWRDYTRGRIRVLESFLNREQIYYLPFFRERFEMRARSNIAREIELLCVSLNHVH